MHRNSSRRETPATSSTSTTRRVASPSTTATTNKKRKGKGKKAYPQPPTFEEEHTASSSAGVGEEERVDVVLEGEIKEQRIMSLHAPYMGDLAVAWYDPEERKIQVLEDTKDTLSWDLACLCMEQIRPTLIIMSSKTHNSVIEKVEAYCEENKTADVLLLPSRSCYPKVASIHVASIRLPDHSLPQPTSRYSEDLDGHDDVERMDIGEGATAGGWRGDGAGMGTYRLNLVKLGCWVNVNAPLAVVATGILVEQVSKCRAMEVMPREQIVAGLELTALESLDLERHMLINRDALTSLAIFDVESHAFIYSDKDKQALSIFGKLDTTVTPLGRKLLHTWHLRPLLSLSEIACRHEAVGVFSATENEHIVIRLRSVMKGVRNVYARCTRLRTGNGGYADWSCLVDSITAAVEARNIVGSVPAGAHLPVMREAITDKLITFCQDMNAVIDWDTSRLEGRVAVQPGIDDELDGWREMYAGLDATLNQVAHMIYPQVPPGVSLSVNVVYLPQLGYLAVIQADTEDAPDIPGWEVRFYTEDRYYYKTAEMEDLDDHFGDLYTLMIGKEIEIIQKLTEHLEEYEYDVLATTVAIAELDCILALAKAARDHGLVRPTMTEHPVLKIRKGRHILYESLVPRYIENDTMIASNRVEDLASMMIITGANGSGKSAYGKQVALIAFMAQIGCFVPAEEATIGICDKIFTRLQTRESTSRHASAFMIDLAQISQALRGVTNRSLVIIDEFGKGTCPTDGAGLLAGVIEYLLQGACPRSVVMTHFHELFANHFITEEDYPVRFCHMKTMLLDGTDDFQYLYKLIPSLSLTSNAAECALRHGIPLKIITRAKEVTECISKFEIAKLLDATMTESDIQEIDASEELAKKFLTWDIDSESEDVMEILRAMLEATKAPAQVSLGSDDDDDEGGSGFSASEYDQDESD